MLRRACYLVLIAVGVPVAGCASRSVAADRSIDALRADLARMRSEQDFLRQRLEAVELGSVGDRAPHASLPHARPDMQVVVLKPEGGANTSDDAAFDEGPDESTDGPAAPVRSSSSHRTRQGGRAPAMTENPEREFAAAVVLARGKDYDRAVNALTGFVVHYPDDRHVADAIYMLGQCYYEQNDLVRAAQHFEGLVARFPQAHRAADATVKLASIYKSRGDTDKAREALARLKTTYPKRDAAPSAPDE